ncbi:hypothetical protein C5167_031433 [Papaver somniferum]|uniref:Uncharacterized protein n=1 Tax=Papaver somniferum TaxID=3469 RepID=A0A4Y7K5S2_PAPSO|nr:hypothetical protein C5167_031433 [Papaver somniferum]
MEHVSSLPFRNTIINNSVAPGREALYREYEDLESGN